MDRPALAESSPALEKPVSHALMGVALGLWCLAWPVQAQAPAFPADLPKPAPPLEAPPLIEVNPRMVVTAFEQACVLGEGRLKAAVDWATANDFEPVDPSLVPVDGLLGGQPGTVLTAPGTDGRVKLAISAEQCSVWAERTSGPPLRVAMATLVDDLVASGKAHEAQLQLDRNAEVAGAWRNQMEWRYRADDTDREWRLGVATTLGDGPGTQVLHMAPMAADNSRAGLPPGR